MKSTIPLIRIRFESYMNDFSKHSQGRQDDQTTYSILVYGSVHGCVLPHLLTGADKTAHLSSTRKDALHILEPVSIGRMVLFVG